jgi:hypothetical protein
MPYAITHDSASGSLSGGQFVLPHEPDGVVRDTTGIDGQGCLDRCLWHCHLHDGPVASLSSHSQGRLHPGRGYAFATSVCSRDGSLWWASSWDCLRRDACDRRQWHGMVLSNRYYGCRWEQILFGIQGRRHRKARAVYAGLLAQQGSVPWQHFGMAANKTVPWVCAEKIRVHTLHRSVAAASTKGYQGHDNVAPSLVPDNAENNRLQSDFWAERTAGTMGTALAITWHLPTEVDDGRRAPHGVGHANLRAVISRYPA